jgi:predicted O-linked N-acetylglucosamine transferase (SPINDLY family)/SAM-dependent methyltransferase
MTIPAGRLESLLEQINGGRAAGALPQLDRLLQQQPANPAILVLRAEALRLLGRLPEAVEAFRHAGERGAGTRSWLLAGMLLAAERKTDEALTCLRQALAESPDDEQVLDTLVTTLFNANRHRDAIEYARRQLTTGRTPRYLSNAALLLQSNDLYEESCDAFKRIVQLAPEDPAIVGAALGPSRFTCEWELIESLQRRISAWYDQGEFAAPQEYPLTHLTWCMDEARNLAVTRAYAERTVPRVQPCTPVATPTTAVASASTSAPTSVPGPTAAQRLRIGYLSCDFRNHATMHLMAGLFECHDRTRFEVFAYDYSGHDISDYRQRFLDAIEHHIPIHSLSDQQAAERIAQDRLDILFDLKVYTGGCRPGILAHRPAPLQAAYLGFPGSAANEYIDYIVSDRFVTPDSSAPHYTERFCRLPHSYQCNDRKRFSATAPGSRSMHGLPDDGVVYGAFNQSYKVDRSSFSVWLRVLQEVPGSVLWLLGQSPTAIEHLSRYAQLAGIDPGRLIFAPFAVPRDHLARLQLADAVLDTLVCNGHTTTSDALWAGVPVISCRGRHFASRVSESLLNAIDLPELVGSDHDDMVRIARRIGTDAEYRAELRHRVAANRACSALFDTARFTRNFESAIGMMIARHRSGAAPDHIDVADTGPLPPRADALPVAPLQASYAACPLCAGASVTLGFADATRHALWHQPLPRSIEWMRCPSCSHVHTRQYWTPAGWIELQRATPATPAASVPAPAASWASVIHSVVALLGGYRAVVTRETRPIWVDAGCGDGALLMNAADYGFAAVGLETDPAAVARLQGVGCNALLADFLQLKFEVVLDVLSLMDVLQQIPFPRAALHKAAQVLRPGGVLVVSMPDWNSSSWKAMDAGHGNPYWTAIDSCHHFSRERIVALLQDSGFDIVDFALPGRNPAQMELYSVRK